MEIQEAQLAKPRTWRKLHLMIDPAAQPVGERLPSNVATEVVLLGT
jgi:hypothetical protein